MNDIEKVTREFYASRLRNDADGCMSFFAKDCCIEYAGSSDASDFAARADGFEDVTTTVQAIIETWDWKTWEPINILVDGNEVAVRYSINTVHTPTGKSINTEIMDYLKFDDELKLLGFVEFADTALIQGLQ